MEGYLGLWNGILSGWKKTHFELHNDILSYAPEKGANKEGNVHLKVASIIPILDDPLRFSLNTGSGIMELRASDINSRIEWIRALNQAQSTSLQVHMGQQIQQIDRFNTDRNKIHSMEAKTRTLSQLSRQLQTNHRELEDIVGRILTGLSNGSSVSKLCGQLTKTANSIKHKTSEAVDIINDFQINMKKTPVVDMQYPGKSQNSLVLIDEIDEFKSFSDIDPRDIGLARNISNTSLRLNRNDSLADYKSFDGPMGFQRSLSKLHNGTMYNSFATPADTGKFHTAGIDTSSYKQRLVTTNPAFQATGPISREPERTRMHIVVPPSEVQILPVLKGLIGQDLSRVSMPVFINQPLSILQKACLFFYYSQLLDQANHQSSAVKRLLYVVAFNVSMYSLSVNRARKPFNPLLGQTFEYIDKKRNFKFLTQQVSHHPPYNAVDCQNDNFQVVTCLKGSPSFRGTSVKMVPEGGIRVVLKKHNETITFNRCTGSLNNIVVGTKYFDNYGEINYTMRDARGMIIATAYMNFKEAGMFGGNSYVVDGWIRDQANTERYVLQGKWNESLTVIDKESSTKEIVWKMTHKCDPNYYNYTDMDYNLNFLNEQLLREIAPTDSRLRPDQRAWQYNLGELATTEKNRLENTQRQRRKENEKNNIEHRPLWFYEKKNPFTNEDQWLSNSEYWLERKSGNWSRCPQIF